MAASLQFSAQSNISCPRSVQLTFFALALAGALWYRYSGRSRSSSAMSGEFSIAYVTVPNKEEGKKIAAALLEDKLAACVNIVPGVESYYWWEGKVENDPELLLMIKTRTSIVPQVIDKVKGLHPYDVCEVITTPISAGNPAYMAWLQDSITHK